MLKFLDCFCGMGGASEGFYKEGFECTGIDIINVGYPYKLIISDMRELDGLDYQGYDVIWGSPPCRDFSVVGDVFGHTWKRPPDPQGKGMELVNSYLTFIEKAKPIMWILENVPRLQKYYKEAKFCTYLGDKHMKRCFWGEFPNFLIPKDAKKVIYHHFYPSKSGKRKKVSYVGEGLGKKKKWITAKIPLTCSLAFARACKEILKDGSTRH